MPFQRAMSSASSVLMPSGPGAVGGSAPVAAIFAMVSGSALGLQLAWMGVSLYRDFAGLQLSWVFPIWSLVVGGVVVVAVATVSDGCRTKHR